MKVYVVSEEHKYEYVRTVFVTSNEDKAKAYTDEKNKEGSLIYYYNEFDLVE